MSKQTTSSRMPALQVEIGTLVPPALEITTHQAALTVSGQAAAEPCGRRNARPHFAVPHPGVLRRRQDLIPHL
jgi:hypothetical protein